MRSSPTNGRVNKVFFFRAALVLMLPLPCTGRAHSRSTSLQKNYDNNNFFVHQPLVYGPWTTINQINPHETERGNERKEGDKADIFRTAMPQRNKKHASYFFFAE